MKYRKKPVVIEAWQFKGVHFKDYEEMPQWLSDAMNGEAARLVSYQGGEGAYFTIHTLEGRMHANIGDYIIRGIKGELYPCKPDIFEATYEKVEDETD